MKDHLLNPRQRAIVNLLRLYRDLETGHGQADGPADRNDSRVLYELAGDWDQSGCDDLDNLLTQLRQTQPGTWCHLTERYIRCTVKPTMLTVKRNRKGQIEPAKLPANAETLGHGIKTDDLLNTPRALFVVEYWMQCVTQTRVIAGIDYLVRDFPWDRHRWSILAA